MRGPLGARAHSMLGRERGKLADAIERTWGTPKSYMLGGYEM
ncbi:MAG: hypothetical protein RRE21_06195 [Desulfurococcales archaeon]|nr:hypothetical protein [Desulfurococcales archaeon]